MKIIVSHDVDHLYWSDHLTDLFYPKLWVRETLAFIKGKISAKEWWKRMCIPFHRNLHHLDEITDFDKANGIPSTFFFGMANGLGMSYKRKKALGAIKMVQSKGFETGVHGIAFDDAEAMKAEYNAYHELTGSVPSGIRMHYVRYTNKTFEMLNQAGYLFDSTEFNKYEGCCIKPPYRVGTMWEFPLCIMDVYLPCTLAQAQAVSLDLLDRADMQHIEYFSLLMHDTNFSDAYPHYLDWYKWFIAECKKRESLFTNYNTAINQLNLDNFGGKQS